MTKNKAIESDRFEENLGSCTWGCRRFECQAVRRLQVSIVSPL